MGPAKAAGAVTSASRSAKESSHSYLCEELANEFAVTDPRIDERRMMIRAQILTVPGYTGSGPGHWQSLWERSEPLFRRVEQRDWDNPEPREWSRAIDEAVAHARQPVVLAAHSCGVTAVLHWAARHGRGIAGAFLVAPPDHERTDLEAPVRAFGPVPLITLPFPALVVASEDDPYCTFVRSRELADAWGAGLVSAGLTGHINTASGHGPWPEGRRLLAQFLDSL